MLLLVGTWTFISRPGQPHREPYLDDNHWVGIDALSQVSPQPVRLTTRIDRLGVSAAVRDLECRQRMANDRVLAQVCEQGVPGIPDVVFIQQVAMMNSISLPLWLSGLVVLDQRAAQQMEAGQEHHA